MIFCYIYIATVLMSAVCQAATNRKSVLEYFPAFHSLKSDLNGLNARLNNEFVDLNNAIADLKNEIADLKTKGKSLFIFKKDFPVLMVDLWFVCYSKKSLIIFTWYFF